MKSGFVLKSFTFSRKYPSEKLSKITPSCPVVIIVVTNFHAFAQKNLFARENEYRSYANKAHKVKIYTRENKPFFVKRNYSL